MNKGILLWRMRQGCANPFAPIYCDSGGSSTSTQQNYSPEESARRTQVMDEAARIYGQTAGAATQTGYPGTQPVPFAPQTVAAQQYAQDYALGPAITQANNINAAVDSGFSTMLDPQNATLRQYTEPQLTGYYNNAIGDIGSLNAGTTQALTSIADQSNAGTYTPNAQAGSSTAQQAAIDAATRAITESYTDTGGVMGQIRTGAGEAGQFGSSRQGIAEGIAAGRYFDAVGDTSAKIANEHQLQNARLATDTSIANAGYNTDLEKGRMATNNNLMNNIAGMTEQQNAAVSGLSKGLIDSSTSMYGQDADTFGRTLAFAPQALQTGLMPSTILGGIGAQNEMQQQQINDYLANSRMWDYNAPWQPLENYASVVFGGANPSATTSTDTEASAMQTAGTAASAGVSAYLLYSMLAASDRRLKQNILLAGKDDRTGLNLYEFEYIGEPGHVYRGVMADEVEKVMPQAVFDRGDGYKTVHYGVLGIPFVYLGEREMQNV